MRKTQRLFLLVFLLVAAMILPACSANSEMNPTSAKGVGMMQWTSPPAMTIDQGKNKLKL